MVQVKEDALKQLKRLQQQVRDLQKEAEDANQSREDMAAALRENDKRVSFQLPF